MSTPEEEFEQLLDEAAQLGHLPLDLRTAEKISQHSRFKKLGHELLLFHRGFASENELLIKLVARLHAAYRETSPGYWVVKPGWADERIKRHRELIEHLRTFVPEESD